MAYWLDFLYENGSREGTNFRLLLESMVNKWRTCYVSAVPLKQGSKEKICTSIWEDNLNFGNLRTTGIASTYYFFFFATYDRVLVGMGWCCTLWGNVSQNNKGNIRLPPTLFALNPLVDMITLPQMQIFEQSQRNTGPLDIPGHNPTDRKWI